MLTSNKISCFVATMLFSSYFWFKWIVLEISVHVNDRIQTIIGTWDEFHALIQSKIPKRKREKNKTAKRKGPNLIVVCPLHYSTCDDEIIWDWDSERKLL